MCPGSPLQQQCRWQVFPDVLALYAHALAIIERMARESVAARGMFRIVLAGGGTPQPLYHRLRSIETDWSRWHVYYGDERCLPPDDPARNSFMARAAWLDHVPIPAAQIHTIDAGQGAVEAARRYARELAGIDLFDLVLLGLGEDGHTASLFPGHELGASRDMPPVLAVTGAPKPPPNRVTLSAWRLSRARAVVFLVTGESKRPATLAWRAGADIPARAIAPASGVDVLADTGSYGP
jgi:6-phosphogluconolactonase